MNTQAGTARVDRRIDIGVATARVAACVLSMVAARAVCAQMPDAGSALREALPAPARRMPPPAAAPASAPVEAVAPPVGPAFVLRSIVFKGATLFTDAELRPLAAGWIGRRVTFADLESIAQQVTDRYRAADYMLALALVPAQDVTDGQVEISIVEGVIGAVRSEVDPGAPIDAARVLASTARITPGRPLRQRDLVRTMLLLSDLPGVAVQAELESGEAAGSSDLAISVKPTRRWEVAFDADNHGSRAVAEYRAGLQARLNGPFGIGDNLDLRLQVGDHGGLAYGRLGYERPLGMDGHRVTLAYSRLQYSLGQDYAALDATGHADVVDLAWAYPFIRSRSASLLGTSLLQYKKLQDRFGAFSLVNDKTVRSVNAGLSYEGNDQWLGGGYTNVSLTVLVGDLALDMQRQRDEDAQALRTRGRFIHGNYSASRLNALTHDLNLFVGVVGQLANRNLDSAEKVALGGPHGVRAYAPSEATADVAHVATAELRYSVTGDASLQAFYDSGWARLSRDPLPDGVGNNVHRSGIGVGVFWAASGFTLRASLAWRVTGPGTAESGDRSPRLYAQLSKSL